MITAELAHKVAVVIRCLPLAALPFFLGCAKDHHLPPAELGYLGFSKQSANSYQVRFTADADLLNIFKPEDSPVGGLLRCSLVGDAMPSEHSSERYVAKGLISSLAAGPTASPFVFDSSLMFVENHNEWRIQRVLNSQELRGMLGVRQSVPCVYWATAYGFKAYRSSVLRIPSADILRELDK
ncbi:hypothetical protein P9K38_17750 [Pseudomonas sp. 905_Psudmo1]|nr:hypothetical protein [Pseudomonas sp. 905_Psudmo1]WFS17285.1 hypothetical protein P9K38_17750 [Pseudomonas sp. 905_Psudmo1]